METLAIWLWGIEAALVAAHFPLLPMWWKQAGEPLLPTLRLLWG